MLCLFPDRCLVEDKNVQKDSFIHGFKRKMQLILPNPVLKVLTPDRGKRYNDSTSWILSKGGRS